MKLIKFYYFFVYKIVLRTAPHKDPKKATIGDIAMPLASFLSIHSFILLLDKRLWDFILSAWSTELVNPSKYNLLAPSAVFGLLIWFLSSKTLKFYFANPIRALELDSYFISNNAKQKNYENLCRFLTIFFLFAPFLTLAFWTKFGLIGFTPVFSFLVLIEMWIRYEFKWAKARYK
ncbi:hypothetical protein [Pseudoalteromonas sp.]|uniref:hypothetical protein n=1 Tax=Pseudoalteromonas sp. TaxID=53249 RepID=UPI0035619707